MLYCHYANNSFSYTLGAPELRYLLAAAMTAKPLTTGSPHTNPYLTIRKHDPIMNLVDKSLNLCLLERLWNLHWHSLNLANSFQADTAAATCGSQFGMQY